MVTDTFFLTDKDNRAQSFQLKDVDVLIAAGHVVSCAWAVRGRKKSGFYFLVYDHSTGESFYSHEALGNLTFPYPVSYISILILIILPLPLAVFFGVVARLQRAGFRKKGAKPLIAVLDSKAANIPQQQWVSQAAPPPPPPPPSTAIELERLAALRQQGILSDEEFAAQKAKLLA